MIQCPKCGSQAREERWVTSTLVYYTPIYDENGVNTNPDRNAITTLWECRSCGEKYETKGTE